MWQDWGWWPALVSPKVYMPVEGETFHKHENMDTMHLTDRVFV